MSDQLKNVKDVSEIKDVSTLQNIENVKGDEAFTQKSNSITWNGDSKDICYQGTTTQALPVGVTITYTLDGKSISAGELQGKSGHLRIRYQYQNTSGKNGSEYTPFLRVTGLFWTLISSRILRSRTGSLSPTVTETWLSAWGFPG